MALTRMSIGSISTGPFGPTSDEFRGFVPQHQPIARNFRFKLDGIHGVRVASTVVPSRFGVVKNQRSFLIFPRTGDSQGLLRGA